MAGPDLVKILLDIHQEPIFNFVENIHQLAPPVFAYACAKFLWLCAPFEHAGSQGKTLVQ
jgi:hypothetical protein